MNRRHARIGTLIVVFSGLYAQGCGARDGDGPSAASALGSSNLVISQVYGGGGNSGAPLSNDFVEIFNRGSSAVSLSGWSVQYASASGSSWQVTSLSGTVQPGKYYLVQESGGTSGGSSLPAADATGSINLSATAGKVALVSSTTALSCSSGCVPSSQIADFVGYGSTASSFEGSGPAAAPSNTTSDQRAGGGCTDTDDNSSDFAKGNVTPRNSASTVNSCGGSPPPQDAGGGTDSGGGGGQDAGGGGNIHLPSPTLAPRTLSTLAFGMVGDTRPPTSTTGHYPSTTNTVIRSVFSGFQAQGIPLAVGSGDYAFSSTSAGSAVPQYDDYMSARSLFSGTFLPTMGNHECNGFTDGNCPVGSFTGMAQDYINTIVQPTTGQSNPYYSALYTAADGSWSAKFVFIAANAWDSTQNTWLANTLAVPTTYTFTIRHEPSNDTRAPGTTPSESLISSSFGSGGLTLSITGHTHLVQLPGGTQPYGDSFGSTQAYEIIVGNGGAPLDAGPTYGYAVATRRAGDGAIVTQMYEAADSSANPITPNVPDPNFRFAVNPNGSPNSNTSLP